MNSTSKINLKDQIIDLYNKNIKVKDIALLLSISQSTVSRYVKKYSYIIQRRTYDPNHNFFSNIDSELKAYILGLMFSDGNVAKRDSCVKLSMIDQDAVSIFSKAFYNKNIIKKYKNNYICYVYSKQIKSDLISIGCSPNKTFTVRFPKIDPNLYRHFIRGYLDGDGCIVKRPYVNFTSSSEKMIEDLFEVISNKFYCYKYTQHRKKDVYILNVSKKKNTIQFLDWIYKDASCYMKRKFITYIEVCHPDFLQFT